LRVNEHITYNSIEPVIYDIFKLIFLLLILKIKVYVI